MAPAVPSADTHPFDALVDLMALLRSAEGCPWDREQTLESLKPYAIEEVYEVLEAIDAGEPEAHRNELGDLLFQIVFQSQIRSEEGTFGAHDVCRAIFEKLLRRHPELFESKPALTADQAHEQWEAHKAAERAQGGGPTPGLLEGVPRSLPALLRAQRIGEKAAQVGFDWAASVDVLPKIAEEIHELEEAVQGGQTAGPVDQIEAEFGDLLLTLCSLGRHLGISPEQALQASNDRFCQRFAHMEAQATATDQPLLGRQPDELEALWDQAKKALTERN